MKTRMIAVVLAASSSLLYGQDAGFQRKMLQDQDVSGSNRHAVQVHAVFAPGAKVGRHTHPGEELSYVLDGSLVLEIDGQPPRTLKAGETFFIPAGVVHAGHNAGKGPATVLATYVVEKGKPVASPAK